MNLRQTIPARLREGATFQDLLQIVRENGLDPSAGYAALEQVWEDLRFDELSDAPGQGELEFAMERLWRMRPAGV